MPRRFNPFIDREGQPFAKSRKSWRAKLESIPEDGCLLVFNGKHKAVQPLASRSGYQVFVLDPFQKGQETRDFWIGHYPLPNES